MRQEWVQVETIQTMGKFQRNKTISLRGCVVQFGVGEA